jgi:hypothetical protein
MWFNYTSNIKSHITLYDGLLVNNELEGVRRDAVVEKAQFKAALRRYLNAHSFYSVDEFLMSTVNL